MAAPRFEVVDDEISPPKPEPGSGLLLLAITSLSKRALVAAADLFCLLTVGSAFYIWYLIIGDPNAYQLVGAAGYALFILAANWIVRRK